MTQTPASFDRTAIRKQLFHLAVPTFGQLIAEPAFVLIDTAIVGHISTSSLAGLSVGSTIILTALGLCNFLAYSTTSHVAMLMGAGKVRAGLRSGINGMWLALGIGLILAVGLFAGASPLCWAIGARGQDLTQAVIYTRAVVLGAPGMLLVYAVNGILRGLQKVTVTLWAAVGSAALNTLLDFVFIFGAHLGVFGSGLATCLAQWAMGLFLSALVILHARVRSVPLKPSEEGLAQNIGDGFPLFIRTLALRAAMVATVMAAAAMGTQVLASYQAVNSAWNFALNTLDSVAIAGQALVGRSLGEKDTVTTRYLTSLIAQSGAWLGVLVGLIFFFLGLWGPAFFSPVPQLQHLISISMMVLALFFPLQGWMWALDGILIGAGDFVYLAKACSLAALGHFLGLTLMQASLRLFQVQSEEIKIVLLWLVFNLIFMGLRAGTNGLRAKKDVWMLSAIEKSEKKNY